MDGYNHPLGCPDTELDPVNLQYSLSAQWDASSSIVVLCGVATQKRPFQGHWAGPGSHLQNARKFLIPWSNVNVNCSARIEQKEQASIDNDASK
jgi:hypothetical protein